MPRLLQRLACICFAVATGSPFSADEVVFIRRTTGVDKR